jgi:hypothetical protein
MSLRRRSRRPSCFVKRPAIPADVARPVVDLVRLMRLFAEVSGAVEGRIKPNVAHFRPLAAVLNEPVVSELYAADHEFCWSDQEQLRARKDEGWRLVLGHDAGGRPMVFADRKEKLVLLHRKRPPATVEVGARR